MKRISILYGAVGIGMLAFAISALAQNEFKLGIVDAQKVVAEYKRAKEAHETLENATAKLRSQLEGMRKEIQTLEQRLTKGKLFLDESQIKGLENDILQKSQEFQRELENGQGLIVEKEKELLEPIMQEVESLIKKIGEEEGYSLVLQTQFALYVDPSYDLTETVIQTLNERYEEENPPEPSEKDTEKSETPE